MNFRLKSSSASLSLALIVLGGFLLRVAVLVAMKDELRHDRDAYLGIGQNLAEGNGYSTPGTTKPTAFRPPVYPLLIAGLRIIGGQTGALAVVHLVLSTTTIAWTAILSYRLGLGRAAMLPTFLVAVDPVLLQYTALPMTETISTFLLLGLLLVVYKPLVKSNPTAARRGLLIGTLFGLNVLCRPTLWVCGGLLAIWWVLRVAFHSDRSDKNSDTGLVKANPTGVGKWLHQLKLPYCKQHCLFVGTTILGTMIVVSPWLIRNWIVLKSPILTTTHGGYTLLLGNNPVFYSEVVGQPWGTTWEEKSLIGWQDRLETEMNSAQPPPRSEAERDRWMYRRALENLRSQPSDFAAACWLRFRRFWSLAPNDAALTPIGSLWTRLGGAERHADEVVIALKWAIRGFYALVFFAMMAGLFRRPLVFRSEWMPLLLILAGFSLVHLFYWTNMRMRAPVVPVIAVLAGRAFSRPSETRTNNDRPSAERS